MRDVIFHDEDFKKSSLSGPVPRPGGPRCVAVAKKDDVVAVRDTKDPSKTTLRFTKDEWEAFIGGVKLGEFD